VYLQQEVGKLTESTEKSSEASHRIPRASDIMSAPVVTIPAGASLDDAMELFRTYYYSSLPVLDRDSQCVGVLNHKDVVAQAIGARSRRKPAHTPLVRSIMRSGVPAVSPDTSLRTVASRMADTSAHAIPVLADENAAVVGVVARGDLLRALVRSDWEVMRAVRKCISHVGRVSEWDTEVDDGIVLLRARLSTPEERRAVASAVARVPGVVTVTTLPIEQDRASASRSAGAGHRSPRSLTRSR
jgi:CBS domain-containing protein